MLRCLHEFHSEASLQCTIIDSMSEMRDNFNCLRNSFSICGGGGFYWPVDRVEWCRKDGQQGDVTGNKRVAVMDGSGWLMDVNG